MSEKTMPHTFNRLTAHVHWLSPDSATDRPVLGAISGAHGTLIVDAGASPAHAHALQQAIAAAGLPAPRYLALTHWHWDHVFGSAAWDLPTFGHVETQRVMAHLATLDWRDAALDARVAAGEEIAFCRDMMKLELPDRNDLVLRPPDISFTDEVNIELGGVTCRLLHVGGDHAADAVIVFIPEDGVVFLSDCYYQNLYHTPPCYTTTNLLPLLDRLLALHADLYLTGHGDAPLTRAELAAEATLLTQIGRTVDAMGANQPAVLAALAGDLAQPIDDEIIELVDVFCAGLPLS
jgi:glyoxylase-like metal-dependent hydrolase (beta-lactamase superfamily II)